MKTFGNQHQSRKAKLLHLLAVARKILRDGRPGAAASAFRAADARYMLTLYRINYAAAPASSRRRWACGR